MDGSLVSQCGLLSFWRPLFEGLVPCSFFAGVVVLLHELWIMYSSVLAHQAAKPLKAPSPGLEISTLAVGLCKKVGNVFYLCACLRVWVVLMVPLRCPVIEPQGSMYNSSRPQPASLRGSERHSRWPCGTLECVLRIASFLFSPKRACRPHPLTPHTSRVSYSRRLLAYCVSKVACLPCRAS
jgi:hypothetical protein